MKLIFENWRKFVSEQSDDEPETTKSAEGPSMSDRKFGDEDTDIFEPDEPTVIEPHKAVDLEPQREIVAKIEQAAAEKLKTLPSPNKGYGVIVDCWAGNCHEQQMANLHAPLWNRNTAKREFIELGFTKQEASAMRRHLKTDEPGILGMSAMGATRPEMTSKTRKSVPDYIVVHSALTDNPRKTVTVLQARGTMVPNTGPTRTPGNPKRMAPDMAKKRGDKRAGIKVRGAGLSTNYEVYFDGTIYEYFPGQIQTTHAGGHNDVSIGVDLTGTTTQEYDKKGKGTVHTPEQTSALKKLIKKLSSEFGFPSKVAPIGQNIFKRPQDIIKAGYGVVSHENVSSVRTDPGDVVMSDLGAIAENLKRKK